MSAIDKVPPTIGDTPCATDCEYPLTGAERDQSLSNDPEISKIGGWGGARANSGGAREGAGRKPKAQLIQYKIERLPDGPRWYVIRILGGQERRVIRDLLEGESRTGYIQRPSFECCLPTIAVQSVVKGQRQTAHEIMFKGYGFLRMDRHIDPWGLVKQIDGVLELFTTRSFIPIPLPVGFVEGLIDTAAERLNLPKIKLPQFTPGQQLRVESGPFSGHPAMCNECDGLTTKVSVHLFGRDVEIVLPRSGLSVV